MRFSRLACLAALFGVLSSRPALSASSSGFGLEVLVDGESRPEYPARGTVYVEAVRGREYVLRIVNPLPYRVAVALSVDGLNTIDARHTDAWSARKWVLEPYGSMVVPGWQVDGATARSFTFTGEKRSYGAFLGKTENLGVIEAVFFREKQRRPVLRPYREDNRPEGGASSDAAPRPAAPEARQKAGAQAPSTALSNEYAATGMGDRRDNEVETVDLDLERVPAASVRLRYGFRTELVRLGVLPRWPTPLERREGASGFSGGYCPQPDR
jgi:hypothetical protein